MGNRSTDVTAWEVEAARRREVVAADFAGAHQSPNDAASEPEPGDVRTGRLRRWIAALVPASADPSIGRVKHSTACHRVGAVEPGS
jgi:hypothetical protein